MNMTLEPDFVPHKKSGLLERANAGTTVSIMSLDQEEDLYVLDGLSAQVWKQIDGKKNLRQIKAAVNAQGTLPERFSQDVDQLLLELKEEQLVH